MIDDILNAIVQETKAFLLDSGGTFLLKTDYKAKDLPSYTMPLILLDCTEAPDSVVLLGGITRMDWNLAFNSYNYMPDAEGDDTTGTSRDFLIIVDQIRQHFTNRVWKSTTTPTMKYIYDTYCFKFTFTGVVPADAIVEDGMKMGWRIVMESVAMDTSTSDTIQSTQVLTTVTQVENPPFS